MALPTPCDNPSTIAKDPHRAGSTSRLRQLRTRDRPLRPRARITARPADIDVERGGAVPVADDHGHTTVPDAVELAGLVGAKTFVLFHHSPSRADDDLDAVAAGVTAPRPVLVGRQGARSWTWWRWVSARGPALVDCGAGLRLSVPKVSVGNWMLPVSAGRQCVAPRGNKISSADDRRDRRKRQKIAMTLNKDPTCQTPVTPADTAAAEVEGHRQPARACACSTPRGSPPARCSPPRGAASGS